MDGRHSLDPTSALTEEQAAWNIRQNQQRAAEQLHASYSNEPGRLRPQKLPWLPFSLLVVALITNVAYAGGPAAITVVLIILLLVTAGWGIAPRVLS